MDSPAIGSNAPNCSYFVNWKTKDDSMTWDIDVHTAGAYHVEIQYACPAKDLGATVELRFKDALTKGKVAAAWFPGKAPPIDALIIGSIDEAAIRTGKK